MLEFPQRSWRCERIPKEPWLFPEVHNGDGLGFVQVIQAEFAVKSGRSRRCENLLPTCRTATLPLEKCRNKQHL
jgi:hypothetical protein